MPFDVWAAQELGALERGKEIGDVPAEYAALPKALAESNGDGRVVFTPKAGEVTATSGRTTTTKTRTKTKTTKATTTRPTPRADRGAQVEN